MTHSLAYCTLHSAAAKNVPFCHCNQTLGISDYSTADGSIPSYPCL